MKRICVFIFFIVIAFFSLPAADFEHFDAGSYEIADKLLTLSEPGAPMIFEDSAIFTAPSNLRRVGVSFAHENFSTVYWFKQLLVSQDRLNAPIPPGKKVPDPYIDSGIQFFVFKMPENLKELEYRLVVNGLWTVDPSNDLFRRDKVSGVSVSVLPIPQRTQKHDPLNGLPKDLNFLFNAPSGEIVSVAGDFNNWDPFMYELKEGPAGVYSINIPLPSGTYQYVFFNNGKRFTDPQNPRRIYSRDGRAASVIVVP